MLSIKTGDLEVRAGGLVLVAHPEFGMGVEFLQTTEEQRNQVRQMIATLRSNPDKAPELQVEPEGLETSFPDNGFDRFRIIATQTATGEDSSIRESMTGEDALVDLFRNQYQVPVEAFLEQMREQRHTAPSHSA